ncbi:MAG TPA: DUF2127 domain-containing protein [Thermoanaerobaculia bacterium]
MAARSSCYVRRVATSGSGSSKRNRILALIALFRLSKALLLILAGFGALELLRPGMAEKVRDWLASLPLASAHQVRVTPAHIKLAAAAAFTYAALFIVEGVGLWMEKTWAEYLTIIATTSFIPFEAYELIKKVTAIRAGALVANVAIVGYLIALRRKDRFGRRPS